MKTNRLLLDLFCVVILIAAALTIALPRYRVGIDWGDEGFLAYGAVRVLDGQLPNRDFISLQPPLCFYTVAAIFKIFGTSLAALRMFGLSLYLLIPLGIFAVGRNLMSRSLACAAAFPPLLLGLPYDNFIPLAMWQGNTVTLGAVLLYLCATLRNCRWYAVVAGALTIIAMGLRHDQGLYLAIAILSLALAIRLATNGQTSFTIFIWWLIGCAIVAIPLLFFWWVHHAFAEMFRQLVIFPLTTYPKTSALAFPRFSSENSNVQNTLVFLFCLPPLVILIAAIWIVQRIVRRNFTNDVAIVTFLTVWSALFYCQVTIRSDLDHLFITLPPVFLLTAYCCRIGFETLNQHRHWRRLFSVFAVTLVTALLWTISPVVLPNSRTPEEPLAFEGGPQPGDELLALERGGIRVENGNWLTGFFRGVQERVPANKSILALPYIPTVYFLCERRNPTRWNYLWPGDQTEKDHLDLVKQAKADPPALILILREDEFAASAPVILEYVHAEYHHAADFGQLSVYFPNELH